jgi:hypothetical protein
LGELGVIWDGGRFGVAKGGADRVAGEVEQQALVGKGELHPGHRQPTL